MHAKDLFLTAGNLKKNSLFSLIKRKKLVLCDQLCTRGSGHNSNAIKKKNKTVKVPEIFKKLNLRKIAHTITTHSLTKQKGTQLSSFICMANYVLLFSCSGVFPLDINRGKSSQTPYSQNTNKHLTEGMNDNTTSRKTRVRHSTFCFGCKTLLGEITGLKRSTFLSYQICSSLGVHLQCWRLQAVFSGDFCLGISGVT